MRLKLGKVFLRPSPLFTLRHISLHEKVTKLSIRIEFNYSLPSVRSTGGPTLILDDRGASAAALQGATLGAATVKSKLIIRLIDKFLVDPPMLVPPAPYRSPDNPTRDRTPRNGYSPKVPDSIIYRSWSRTKYPKHIATACDHAQPRGKFRRYIFGNLAGLVRINRVIVASIAFQN
jgi:hypothetical protein